MLNARADLGSRDLGAVNGVMPRVSLAEQAGPEESRNDQPEDQRNWCDMPGPHAPPPVGNETILLFRRRRRKARRMLAHGALG